MPGGIRGARYGNSVTLGRIYISGLISGFNSGQFIGLLTSDSDEPRQDSFSSNYWNATILTELSDDAGDNSNLTGVSGINDGDMKNAATFSGWDFNNIWKISGHQQPQLIWE
jgi:hypothetical protein